MPQLQGAIGGLLGNKPDVPQSKPGTITIIGTTADGRKVPLIFDHPPTQDEAEARLSAEVKRLDSVKSSTFTGDVVVDNVIGLLKGAGEGALSVADPRTYWHLGSAIVDGIKKSPEAVKFITENPKAAWKIIKSGFDDINTTTTPEDIGRQIGMLIGTKGVGAGAEGLGDALIRNPAAQTAFNVGVGGAGGALLGNAAGIPGAGAMAGAMVGRQVGRAVNLAAPVGKGLRFIGRTMQDSVGIPSSDSVDAVQSGDELAAARTVDTKAMTASKDARMVQIRGEHPNWTTQQVLDETKRQTEAEVAQGAKIDALMAQKRTPKPLPPLTGSSTVPAIENPAGLARATSATPVPASPPVPTSTPAAPVAQEVPTAGGIRLGKSGEVGGKAGEIQDKLMQARYRAAAKQLMDADPAITNDYAEWDRQSQELARKAKVAEDAAEAKKVVGQSGADIPRQVPKLVLSPEDAAAEDQLKKAYAPSAQLQGMKAAARVPVAADDVPYDPAGDR